MAELAKFIGFASTAPAAESIGFAAIDSQPARLIPGAQMAAASAKHRAAAPARDFVMLVAILALAVVFADLEIGRFFSGAPVSALLFGCVTAGFAASMGGLQKWLQSLRGMTRQQNVLIVGDQPRAQEIANAISSEKSSRRTVKAFLPSHHFFGVHGSAALRHIARRECVDEVIVAIKDADVAAQVIRLARRNRLDVTVSPSFEANQPMRIEEVGGLPLVRVHQEDFPRLWLRVKRVADVAIAASALALLGPLFLLIAIAVKIDSRGPVLYRSLRVGGKGRRFMCYKFRSMIAAADLQKNDLRSKNEREGAFFKIAMDPRVTRTGALLRRYSLDELPQLWNVVRGDMSLVGPRPHPLDDVARYETNDMQRLDVAPGMTGLWQITARQDPSFEHCVALDVEYIRTWHPMLDFQILWKTALCVLQGNGV